MPFGYSAPASAAGGGSGGAGQINLTVTVAASKFVIDTVSQQVLTLLPGMTYRFDVSDSSNSGHLFQFSTTEDGTNNSGSQYSSGYTTNGTAGDGEDDTYVQLDVPVNAPDELYYFCATSGHTGYGAAATLTAIAGAAAGVTTVATKAALDAITPSTVPGQFYFVTATKGMYYSNNTSWTLLGSNSPAWGSFTEDYGNLSHTSAGGGDAGYSNVVLAISGNETITETGTMDSAADPFWQKTKVLFQSRNQVAGVTSSIFNRANRVMIPSKWYPQYGIYGGTLNCSQYGFPQGTTSSPKFGTSCFLNTTNPNNPWDTRWIGMNRQYDSSYIPYAQDWTVEIWIKWNSLANSSKIFNMGPVEFIYDYANSRFITNRSYKATNSWTHTEAEITGMRYSYSNSSITDGNWKHLAWQKEGTAGSFYLNGARVAYDATAFSTEMSAWAVGGHYLLGENYAMTTWILNPDNGFENSYLHLFDGAGGWKTLCNWDDFRYTVGQARYTGSSTVAWSNDKYTTAAGSTTSWTEPTAYTPVIGHESYDGVDRTITDHSPTPKTVYLTGGTRQTSSTPEENESTTPHTITVNGIVDSERQRWKKAEATAPGGWGKAFTSGYDMGALYVKGGSGSGDAGDAFNFGQGNFTIEFWIWMDNNFYDDRQDCVFMDFRDLDANLGNNWTNSDTEPFIRKYATNEKFRYTIGSLHCDTGSDGSIAQGFNPFKETGYNERGYWVHVAFIRTGTSLVGYQNGIAGSAVTDNTDYDSNDYGVTIGRSARHIVSGDGRIYAPYVGTSPTWTYGDGTVGSGYDPPITNGGQVDDYVREGGIAGQIQDIRITKAARVAPALDGSYMDAPYNNPLELSDGGVTHNPTATGAAGSGYPQATSTLIATDEPGSNIVYAAAGTVTVSGCAHTPAHTGSQTAATAGIVIGASSGDVEITPPSAWENDTVVAGVTASDGVNVLTKDITWSVTADAPSDPHWANVTFLLQSNSVANGSTTFTDVSGTTPNTITANGGIAHSTAQYKWGTSSIFIDNSNDNLTCVSDADFQFGSGNFTFECWIKRADTSGDDWFWGNTNYNVNGGWAFHITTGNTLQCRFMTYNISGPVLADTAWHHIAAVRNGNYITIYKDGIGSGGSVSGAYSGNYGLTIGNLGPYYGPYTNARCTCWTDDLRITKGVARYTSNFSNDLPTEYFPTQ